MKSYFSQLAKQSGLRYGRANTNSLAPTAKKEIGEFMPLHREETILAAPVAQPKTDAPQKEKTKSLSPETPPQKIIVKPTENNFAESSKDLKTTSLPTAQNSDTDNQIIPSAAQIQTEISKENKSIEPTAAPADLMVGEQTVFTEDNMAGEKKRLDLSPTQTDFQSEISAQPEIELIEAEPPQSEYFKKTAGHLESGATDKLEIQQILLQEIYEWVNGAPALTGDRKETKKTNLTQPNDVRAVVATSLEERSFVRREAAKMAAENPEKPLEEQNYNLSIGTISIVVEEPPPIQNTTIQKTSTEKAKATKREFSRLSRYYL